MIQGLRKNCLVLLLLACALNASIAQKKKKTAQLTIPKVVAVDLPTIEWVTNQTDSAIVGTNIQTISCIVRSRLPLTQIELKVNGVVTDVYTTSELSIPVSVNNYEQRVERTVTLRTGRNTLSVVAANNNGQKTEGSRRIVVDPSMISLLRDENDKTPPMIFFSSPSNMRDDRVTEYTDQIKISGTIMDEAGIQSLTINNTVTPVKANGAFTIYLPLIVGENVITVEVKDINQNIALRKLLIERRNMDGTAYNYENAKNHLLIIGINSYTRWPMLNNAVSDARAVADVLTKKYRFDPDNVTMILDSAATRANIYAALRNHIEKVSPQDNLLIYYSGHGYFDKLLSEGYWVPVDGAERDVSSYVPNSQILKIIENINSQHTFLVADACFSGSLFATTTRGTYSDHIEKYRSRWGLASGRLELVSDGTSGTASPFAQSFIDFLNTNQSSKVAVTDLIQYVKKKVTELTEQTPIGNPLKGVGDDGGEFVFYRRQ